ncbi:MAG: hypothetical protein N4A46_01130, partial [Schleiferiaceae bacterium]|nr:hypothetical protein [Schleiferiaceae bacterium]
MKKAILIFSAFVILLFVLIKGGELWLELNFEKTINEDENRAYDITYSDLDFHTLFKGVTLEKVAIVPLRIDSSTYVKGEVEYATIKGLVWLELMFNGRLNIEEVSFEKPVFEVNIGTKKNKKNSGQGIQSLFGDILSRGDLSSFNIYHGKVIIKEPDGNIKGRIRNIDIKASEIETDSIKLQHIIPFRMGNLNVTIDSAMFQLNEFTQINLGDIHYELKDEVLSMHNFSIGFTEDWVKVSKRIKVQKDLISAHVKELKLIELATSSEFYSNLDLVAKKLEVNGLDLKVRKNKNFQRPPDTYKPMFKGMVDLIPIQLDVDSILITDSQISYEELGKDKKHSAEISFRKIEGSITGLTTFEEEQKQRQEFVANLNAELYNSGKMKIKLTVPYEEDRIELISDMGSMPMEDFNALAIPMAAVQIDSGQLK